MTKARLMECLQILSLESLRPRAYLEHSSDSNISSDYIAIFLSLISSFYGQHFKISNVQLVEK